MGFDRGNRFGGGGRDRDGGGRGGGRGGGFGGGRGGGFGGGGRDFNRGPRVMHKATCSDCGKETEVPFEPVEGRPVYCRDCFMKHRNDRFGSKPFGNRPEQKPKEEVAPVQESEEETEESEDEESDDAEEEF